MIVDCAVYQDGLRRPGEVVFEDALEAGRGHPGAFVWIGVFEPNAREFDALRREFELHPLAVEDAIHAHQRAKIEVYGETLFVVLKTARYDDATETVHFGEIQLFVGEGFVVTVRHGKGSALADVRHVLEADRSRLSCGPYAVLHAVADRVVDDYAPVLTGLDDDIREIEAQVFTDERSNPTERIYKLKREVLDFHRNTKPFAEALNRLVLGAVPHSRPELTSYFRDVYDHLLRVVGEIEDKRDVLSDALNANLAQVSVRQNDDMRAISAWVAIAAVPTVFGAVYGMNFEHMPELGSRLAYPAVLAVIVVACVLLWRRFKRAGWL
jgi:magnesium transporter